MKNLLLSLFLVSLTFLKAGGQKIALLHKNFKQPIIYTDSITVEQISSGYFPVEINTLDTFHANLKYLQGILRTRQRAKMESFELRSGKTFFKVSRIPFAYGDRYSITVQSKFDEVESQFSLVDINKSNLKNAEKIEELIGYVNKNKSLFRSANEITPKIYNIVVITDR